MNAGAKLAAFALVLAAMVGGGAALGSAVGPIDVGDAEGPHGGGHTADRVEGHETDSSPARSSDADIPAAPTTGRVGADHGTDPHGP